MPSGDVVADPVTYAVPPAAAPPAAPKPAAKPPAPKPPPAPFKPLFFNNDFSYKKAPDHPYIFGEELKDIPIGDYTCWDWMCESKLSFGANCATATWTSATVSVPAAPAIPTTTCGAGATTSITASRRNSGRTSR